MQHKEQILSAVEFRQHRPVAVPKQNGIPEKSDVISSQKTFDNLQRGLVGKTRFELPQKKGTQVSGKIPTPVSELQYFKLQKLSSQQAVAPVQAITESKYTKVSFAKLLPYILPQLDKDRARQLQTLFEKLRKNEIARDQFVRSMGSIVGNQMLKLAAEQLKAEESSQILQSALQKSEIQVQTPSPKQHTGQGNRMPSELQTAKLAHQKSDAEETKSSPSLSAAVHPSTGRNTLTTGDAGCLVNNQLSSQTTTSPAAMHGKAPSEKPYIGQKKPLENPDSSLQPLSKKQKMSVPGEDQSIEQLNDVTVVSGVNLREEEEQLLSRPKEESRVSEASVRAVREEEGKMILEKVPLQKKLAEIMAKCGMKNVSKDVERCLSLGVEERLRGLLCNLIRYSKQRVDGEKHKHKTVITSDIHQHLMILNRRAKEELEKKEAEAEKLTKTNEPETSNTPDGKKEKDDGRGKSRKVNKEEDDKMRATAANVAARAAVGGDDHLSKWQLMAERAQQRREGAAQAGSNPSAMFGRIMTDGRGSERGQASHLIALGAGRKLGRNQIAARQQGVPRSISIKDMISVLERETQMAKSTLIYNLYNRIPSDRTRDT